jgi:hypothetical protein
MELRKSASKAEALRISGVNAGNEGAYQAIEKLRREFSTDEGGDRFVIVEGIAFSEDVAQKGPFRGAVDHRTHEERGRAERSGPELAVNEDVPGSPRRGLQQFVRNAEINTKFSKPGGAAEALRA